MPAAKKKSPRRKKPAVETLSIPLPKCAPPKGNARTIRVDQISPEQIVADEAAWRRILGLIEEGHYYTLTVTVVDGQPETKVD